MFTKISLFLFLLLEHISPLSTNIMSMREDIELSHKAIFPWSSEMLLNKPFKNIFLAFGFMSAKSQGSSDNGSFFNLLIFPGLSSNNIIPNILFIGQYSS